MLAVSSTGDLVGSVSGGCIEGAVRGEALSILEGAPARIVEYGIDNESAWSVGLSCGGSLKVLIQCFPSEIGEPWLECIETGERAVVVTVIQDDDEYNLLIRGGKPALGNWPDSTEDVNSEAWDSKSTSMTEIGGLPLFVHVFETPAKLIIVGGADIAVHLVGFAHALGFDSILIDPRAVFSDESRFPVRPTRIETAWPQEVLPDLDLDIRTYAVLLTHDPKIDDPAIRHFLDSSVPYIGALGGKRTQEKRRDRLRVSGYPESEIDRIRGPVGIDIGALTPSEIALSIMAEVIEVHRKHQN